MEAVFSSRNLGLCGWEIEPQKDRVIDGVFLNGLCSCVRAGMDPGDADVGLGEGEGEEVGLEGGVGDENVVGGVADGHDGVWNAVIEGCLLMEVAGMELGWSF